MKRIYQVLTIVLAVSIQAVTLPQLADAKGPPVRIDSSEPPDGIQGNSYGVTLFGERFENEEPEIRYIHKLTGNVAPHEKMGVSNTDFIDSTQIQYTLTIADNADVGEYDIEIYYATSGRKGKGTTLFSVISKDGVQPSDCMLDFDAFFDDADNIDPETGEWLGWLDGVRSDNAYDENGTLVSNKGPYYAFGGTGMRLDTNGSQILERKNDTRFLTIDFTANGECDRNNPHNPGGAAGFCTELKGVDMRFEHQVQELEENGLCLLEPGESMRISVGILFEQSSGPALLSNEFKNGKQNGDGIADIRLNYGCQAPRLLQSDLRIGPAPLPDYRTVVTRVDEYTWRVVGQTACLHTNLGYKLENTAGETLYLQMPFGLTLVDVNAPPDP